MKSAYYQDEIHCQCGQCFRVGLETRLSDELWEDRFDTEHSGEEQYVCPRCGRQFLLEIKVEMTVETVYLSLEEVGQVAMASSGVVVDIAALRGAWIGDKIVLEEDHGEEVLMPDGVYVTGEKEYKVVDGIVVEYWGVPDENQLNLFEECTT